MAEKKVAITERAAFQRVSRFLKKQGEKLCTARFIHDGPRDYENHDLGRYYVLDTNRNMITSTHVDLEPYARELKVVRPWEEIKSDE